MGKGTGVCVWLSFCISDVKVIYLHRKNQLNAGDYWATPYHYFGVDGEVLDTFSCPVKRSDVDLLVLGGGGILEPHSLDRLQSWINFLKPKKKVIWGAGSNRSIYSHVFFRQFDLCGLRNYKSPFDFIPCVSCMHELLDTPVSNSGGLLVVGHNKRPLPNQIHDQHVPIELSIRNISIASAVVTTSYHIYYWSRLMGKPTHLAIDKPFQTWTKGVADKYYTIPPEINLEDFRDMNKKFAEKVFNLI